MANAKLGRLDEANRYLDMAKSAPQSFWGVRLLLAEAQELINSH
jgi:hypothetical protein